MKLGIKEHVCKYFTNFHREPMRWCKQCHKRQYKYTGEWIPAMTFEQLVEKWSSPTGNGVTDLIIETATDFEYRTYENWGRYFNVKSLHKGVEINKVSNWNEADWKLSQKLLPKPIDKQE